MNLLALSIIILAVLVGAYLWWRVPRWESVFVSVIVLFGTWALCIHMLGVPRPVSHDILSKFKDVPVIAYELQEPKAIYLWLRRDEPMAYRLPWNELIAKKLHSAAQQAEAAQTGLQAHRNDGEWTFHAKPIEPLPPKE